MSSRRTFWLLLPVKLAVTGALLAWAISRTSFAAMQDAVLRISPGAFAAAVGLLMLNLAVGTGRWRALMRAYPGVRVPSMRFLAHGFLVAGFYNTFLPGSVAGDVLRAYAVRKAFVRPADSYVVVLLERGLGLAALVSVVGFGAMAAWPAWRWRGAGLVVIGAVLAAISSIVPELLSGLALRLPTSVASRVPRLSPAERKVPFASAFVWSILSQGVSVLVSHVLIRDLAPIVRLSDSLALVPVAMLTLYVPVSFAGLGLREAAFVVLFARVGVSAADATAASLAFMAALMAAGLIGGVAHALSPLEMPSPEGDGGGDSP